MEKKGNFITQNWILHPNHDYMSLLFVETKDISITHTINMKHVTYTLWFYEMNNDLMMIVIAVDDAISCLTCFNMPRCLWYDSRKRLSETKNVIYS